MSAHLRFTRKRRPARQLSPPPGRSLRRRSLPNSVGVKRRHSSSERASRAAGLNRPVLVIGGVIVAPKASELVFPLALAVEHRLTVDQVARAFTVYPSLSGSIADAARAMHIVN